MIDFHNHVLPDVDDGPKTLEESMTMIRHASKQGVTVIVQTVHFQHPKMVGKNVNFKYLNNKINELQKKINREELNIEIHLSAEVYYKPNLIEISDNPLVTFGNSKYMLIEFATYIEPLGYQEEFYKLQIKDICPVIAHPERYRFIQNDLQILDTWIDRGYIIQIDAGSIIGHFGKKIKSITMEILNKGCVHIIGSDAHNSKKRNFCLFEAYSEIKNIYGKTYVELLVNNSIKILEGQELNNINRTIYKKKTNLVDKLFNLFKFSV